MKFFKLLLIVGLIVVLTSSFAFGQLKIALDLYTAKPTAAGCSGRDTLSSIGADQNIYVKVYMFNIDIAKSYQVDFSYDKTKLVYQSLEDQYLKDADDNVIESNPFASGITASQNNSDSTKISLVRSFTGGATYFTGDTAFLGYVKFKTASSFTTSDSAFLTFTYGQIIKLNNTRETVSSANATNGAINSAQGQSSGSLPVELSAMNANVMNSNSCAITWTTESEINNYGFEIERSADKVTYKKIGFIEGHGTTNILHDYSYVDSNLPVGTYYYRLKQVDLNGQYKYYDVLPVSILAPNEYQLVQNFPNPFNPETTIKFDLKEPGMVDMKVYNVIGQVVGDLVHQNMEAGSHKVKLDARNLVSGVYFYVLKVNDFQDIKKMVVMK